MILLALLYDISLSKPLGHESNAAKALSSLGASNLLFHTVRTEYGHHRLLSFQNSRSTQSKMAPLTAMCSSYLLFISKSSEFILSSFVLTLRLSEPHLLGGIPFTSLQKGLGSTALDFVQYWDSLPWAVRPVPRCPSWQGVCNIRMLTRDLTSIHNSNSHQNKLYDLNLCGISLSWNKLLQEKVGGAACWEHCAIALRVQKDRSVGVSYAVTGALHMCTWFCRVCREK